MTATPVHRGAPRVCLFVAAIWACGTNVDLGGSVPEAGVDARKGDSGSCPSFAVPEADASCGACDKGSSGCQPNGCYNGYLCDDSERDCKAPGTPCSGK